MIKPSTLTESKQIVLTASSSNHGIWLGNLLASQGGKFDFDENWLYMCQEQISKHPLRRFIRCQAVTTTGGLTQGKSWCACLGYLSVSTGRVNSADDRSLNLMIWHRDSIWPSAMCDFCTKTFSWDTGVSLHSHSIHYQIMLCFFSCSQDDGRTFKNISNLLSDPYIHKNNGLQKHPQDSLKVSMLRTIYLWI